MSSIMEQTEFEHPALFVLEFGKIAESDYVYTLASTNINQSAPNLVKMYVTIRSRMRSIMDLIGPELSELFPLEFAKIAESDFVSSPEHEVLMVSYCDRAVSGVRRASSVVNFLPCVRSRGHSFGRILMKVGQDVCLDEISDEFENGSYGVKN